MSTPKSAIRICSGVALNNDYKHTIWFDNYEKQVEYFSGKVVKTFSDYTYLRKNWSIKVNATMEEASTWSYLYFKNGTSLTSKFWYYFINDIQYINDGTVELFLEMDVMQSYMFEYNLSKCFVEREHVSDDSLWENNLDEGLELGEFVLNKRENVDMDELCVMVLATINPETTSQQVTTKSYGGFTGGVYSGLGVYAVDRSSASFLDSKLEDLDEWGKAEGIIAMWMYPKSLVVPYPAYSWETDCIFHKVQDVDWFKVEDYANTKIDGYTPRNNKLFSYPFNFLYVTNNNGASGVYKYEYFDGKPTFHVYGALSPEGSTRIVPANYKNTNILYEEGISGGNYPTCTWDSDVYKMWLAQNQNQQNLGLITGGLSVAGGLLGAVAGMGVGSGSGINTAIQGATQIANILAQRADKEIQPPQAKGTYSAAVNINAGFQTFTIMQKSIDSNHAKIIDEFFDMYGYKCNRVKIPNRKVRQNWTYTKTVGCHVTGDLCTNDLRKIESIYDNGITFWVEGDNIGKYGLTNTTL